MANKVLNLSDANSVPDLLSLYYYTCFRCGCNEYILKDDLKGYIDCLGIAYNYVINAPIFDYKFVIDYKPENIEYVIPSMSFSYPSGTFYQSFSSFGQTQIFFNDNEVVPISYTSSNTLNILFPNLNFLYYFGNNSEYCIIYCDSASVEYINSNTSMTFKNFSGSIFINLWSSNTSYSQGFTITNYYGNYIPTMFDYVVGVNNYVLSSFNELEIFLPPNYPFSFSINYIDGFYVYLNPQWNYEPLTSLDFPKGTFLGQATSIIFYPLKLLVNLNRFVDYFVNVLNGGKI